MERYNRGFGKFGPLEQCKDGELIFYKDHKKVVLEERKMYSDWKEGYKTELHTFQNNSYNREIHLRKRIAVLSAIILAQLGYLFGSLIFAIIGKFFQ